MLDIGDLDDREISHVSSIIGVLGNSDWAVSRGPVEAVHNPLSRSHPHYLFITLFYLGTPAVGN